MAQLCIFTSHLFKYWAFATIDPSKGHVVVERHDRQDSDCNWTRTHNHLLHKRTLNHLAKLVSLAKWLSVRL